MWPDDSRNDSPHPFPLAGDDYGRKCVCDSSNHSARAACSSRPFLVGIDQIDEACHVVTSGETGETDTFTAGPDLNGAEKHWKNNQVGFMSFGLVQLGQAATSLGEGELAYHCLKHLANRFWLNNMASMHNHRALCPPHHSWPPFLTIAWRWKEFFSRYNRFRHLTCCQFERSHPLFVRSPIHSPEL